ncbi:MAG: hypothetical protein LQ351_004357 [Letrouitia transgressa]|nr:MAG: hypothetical protein LQ351_004357 [Letrouitia transgressa]
MKVLIPWLAAGGVALASSSVFSVHDDFLAFPQYEIVFSESFILDKEADSQIKHAASKPSAGVQSASATSENVSAEPSETSAELSNHRQSSEDNASSPHADTTSSYHSMILKGRPYLCSIPTVETPIRNDTAKAKDKAEEAAELARATTRGWELLEDMEGNCMYFISGWWSYSFCYNTDVKQFHQLPPGKGAPIFPPAADPSTPSYILGKFEKAQDPSPRKQKTKNAQIDRGDGKNVNPPSSKTPQLRAKGDLRYLVQTLSGGTTCDLTGRDRKIEIQFHCHPQSADRIGWIKEVTTCSYLMVIYTPRLCNDVAFLPPRENKANPITCREIVSESEIPEWRRRKSREAERKLVSASSAGRPVVGGIEIGGMKHVGKEGQRLETPPNTAFEMPSSGGGKGEVLAEQESKEKGGKLRKMGDEELKKRGLDPRTVEDARQELAGVASGKGWKLEILDDVEGGRQLRGIVDGNDEESSEEGNGEEADEEDAEAEAEGDEEGEEEGSQEGSEEVYKDEL